MPSPIEMMRQGIQSGDWSRVKEGFETLTGEQVEQTEFPAVDNSKLKQLLEAAFRMVGGETESQPAEELVLEQPQKPKRGRPKKVTAGRVPARTPVGDGFLVDDPDPSSVRQPRAPEPQEANDLVTRHRQRTESPQQGGSTNRSDVSLGGGGRPARAEAWVPPKFNRFVDNPKLCAVDAKHDKLMGKDLVHTPPRPAVAKVEATCGACGRGDLIDQAVAAAINSCEGTYRCDGCVASNRPGR